MKDETSEIKEYTPEIEKLFVQFFMSDAELFVRCLGIIDPKHFSDHDHRQIVIFIKDYVQKYNGLPTVDVISSVIGVKIELLTDLGKAERNWFLDEYEIFARYKALEAAILASPDLLLQHRYGEVEASIKAAVAIGLVKDLGTDYFKDPEARLDAVANGKGAISTGWAAIDEKLFGGLNRGEVTIWCGGSGSGKSLFLQNLAINFVTSGLNVVYLTLELSETLSAMRLDAIVTGMGTRDVIRNRSDSALKVAMFGKTAKGSLRIKQMKNGCTANDMRAYIKEYEIQTGLKVDVLLLDYLDLCMPTNVKISPENLFIKDKYVTENLRDLSVELQLVLVTASQLNRSAQETLEFNHSHISGGISKIQTADNVMGIYTTSSMRESGRYQIQFLKTRSSSGVGSNVDLGFNPISLKIFDLDPNDVGALQAQAKAILDTVQKDGAIKPTSSGVLAGATDLRNLVNRIPVRK